MPVQLGGGIRDIATIESWLGRGIARVVVGTIALRRPEIVKEACRLFPGRIAVAIDVRAGFVAACGWTETSTVRALDQALRFEDSGVAAIVYTDINRDGAMGGVNVEATADLAFALTTPVIASGGVSSIDDLIALKAQEHTGITGVICGRALYDGRINPGLARGLLAAPAPRSASDAGWSKE
jgi:phosphoribosylformimino-5-aminoimidazole carboxamide ribotide isomerase